MLGPKSLGLAMQYNEMREKRWQHQIKEAAVLSCMQQPVDPVEAHSAKAASTSKRYAVALEHLTMLEQSLTHCLMFEHVAAIPSCDS